MTVIAEGIETQAELDYLLDRTSIRIGQGFLLDRPFFIEDRLDPGRLQAA